jgi:plastocyanin domain-containing protein
VVKKQKNKAKSAPISRGTIIFIAIVAAAVGGGAYYFVSTSIPVNSNVPVLGTASNIYILGLHDPNQGYVYDQQSTRQGKRTLSSGQIDSSIHVSKGTLVALHFINEDKDTGTQMDLNIDSFNVHTKQLSYFQAQTITFIADKEGTYSYYSTLHPEMKGTITVDP